jgi:hypothetical protein
VVERVLDVQGWSLSQDQFLSRIPYLFRLRPATPPLIRRHNRIARAMEGMDTIQSDSV